MTSVLLRETLLDHARHPRNRVENPGAVIRRREENPLCGDAVTVYAEVSPSASGPAQGVISRVSFTGYGCVISQAAASLLTEAVTGRTFGDIARLEREDMEVLLGGAMSASRVKCAMLALVALQRGIEELVARVAAGELDSLGLERRSDPLRKKS